jgi:glutamate synthase (NADPH/NADH) small chain
VWRLYDKQNLPTKGIESKGVVQAMTFLTTNKKSLYGEEIPNQILATGKDVIVIVVEIRVLTV